MTKRIHIYCLTIIPALIFAGVILLFYPYYLKPNYIQEIMQEAENHSIRIANHFIAEYKTDIHNFTLTGEFEKRIERDIKGFNLWKVRLFNSDGIIIYSSNKTEIGNSNYKPYFTNIVAKGKAFSKVVNKKNFTASGSITPFDVVETYVPIMEKGKFNGAYEIYLNVTDQSNRVQRLFLNTYIVCFVMVGLFLILVIVSSIIMDINFCKLQKAKEEIKTLKDILPIPIPSE